MSLFGWTAKDEDDATVTATTELNNSARAGFGAAALQPFSVLRPFYERRAAFREREQPRISPLNF